MGVGGVVGSGDSHDDSRNGGGEGSVSGGGSGRDGRSVGGGVMMAGDLVRVCGRRSVMNSLGAWGGVGVVRSSEQRRSNC